MATGVIILGYDLDADNWKEVVWGMPPYDLGRATLGLDVIWRENAAIALFGGGSTNGTETEGRFTVRYVQEHWGELRQFANFRALRPSELEERLARFRLIMDTDDHSLNTVQEMECAREIFLKRDVTRVVIVTSADHISRCLREAVGVFWGSNGKKRKTRVSLSGEASHTYYSEQGIDGVLVREKHDPATCLW